MRDVEIVPYEADRKEAVIALTVAVWAPVFARTAREIRRFVYDAFYPHGWQHRQTADVAALLETEPEAIWVALLRGDVVGFVGLRIHPEDRMGEVHILAVAPQDQRQGIGRALMRFAEEKIRAAGMAMIMVETVGDSGHEPARHAYVSEEFVPWPVARYFREL